MQLSIIASFIILSLSLSLASEHTQEIQDPPSSTLVGVKRNENITLRCASPTKLQWLHSGKDVNEEHLTIEYSDSFSSLHIAFFDASKHAGVYECYEGSAGARFRVEGYDDVETPKGFRPCMGREESQCDHALACFVDGTGRPLCQCESGWTGTKCEQPEIGTARMTNPQMCSYYSGPPLIVLMIFSTGLFVIIVAVFKYRVHKITKPALKASIRRAQPEETEAKHLTTSDASSLV